MDSFNKHQMDSPRVHDPLRKHLLWESTVLEMQAIESTVQTNPVLNILTTTQLMFHHV